VCERVLTRVCARVWTREPSRDDAYMYFAPEKTITHPYLRPRVSEHSERETERERGGGTGRGRGTDSQRERERECVCE